MTRRLVRATPDFDALLDSQLGDERGPDGEPSAHDFLVYEMAAIFDAFAEHWDELPMAIDGRPEYRLLIAPGRLVPMLSVVGQLSPSGVVELVEVWVDLQPPMI